MSFQYRCTAVLLNAVAYAAVVPVPCDNLLSRRVVVATESVSPNVSASAKASSSKEYRHGSSDSITVNHGRSHSPEIENFKFKRKFHEHMVT